MDHDKGKIIALGSRTSNEIRRDLDNDVNRDELEARPAAYSDGALALDFAERHEHDVRYVAAWNKWLVWDGTRWREDVTRHVETLVRDLCFVFSAIHPKQGPAKALASDRTVSAVERQARRDPRLKAVVEQWDADPWLLNTPAGTVDLRSGKLRPHDPKDFCSKITAVAPGGDCPQWRAFLDRVTDGNEELQRFVQRVSGYSLTGVTTEQAMFFLYGTGANGKSVTINTISGILADYHETAPIETFTASAMERHPTDLAGLQGARLVTAIETEEGRRWAESKIKALTGGDPVKARFMRQDFFEFIPRFKLVIAGNHKPGLTTVDEAMRRRLHLLPFTTTIPADERDPHLAEKLKDEWSGILQWMIEGCLEWQRLGGLRPPSAVAGATADYMSAEDDITTWIDERCEIDPDAEETSAALYLSWAEWATETRRVGGAGSQKAFSQKLQDRGYQQRRTGSARFYVGLRVKAPGEVLRGLQALQRLKGDG